jgi:hypothetical protein
MFECCCFLKPTYYKSMIQKAVSSKLWFRKEVLNQNSCTFSNAIVVSKTVKFVTFKHLLDFQNQSILLNRSILTKLQKYFVSKQGIIFFRKRFEQLLVCLVDLLSSSSSLTPRLAFNVCPCLPCTPLRLQRIAYKAMSTVLLAIMIYISMIILKNMIDFTMLINLAFCQGYFV